jgi:hypothetical protein
MEPLLVPLCAILLIAALVTVTVGKARALQRTRGSDGSRGLPKSRDPRWRPRRPVLFKVRRVRRTSERPEIVIPPGSRRL